jgi:uncharacterized membrane protein
MVFSVLLLTAVFAIPYGSNYVLFRSGLSIVYSLLFPGYASTIALFPKRGQLKPLEKVAVSLAIKPVLVDSFCALFSL